MPRKICLLFVFKVPIVIGFALRYLETLEVTLRGRLLGVLVAPTELMTAESVETGMEGRGALGDISSRRTEIICELNGG